MKNDSGMYPFETPMDDMFDHNKDGELTGLETMQRDAMIYESYKQTSNAFDEPNSGHTPSKAKYEKLDPEKDTEPIVGGGWGMTIVCFLAVAIIIGSIVLCVKTGSVAALFIGIIIAIVLLWATGILSFG